MNCRVASQDTSAAADQYLQSQQMGITFYNYRRIYF